MSYVTRLLSAVAVVGLVAMPVHAQNVKGLGGPPKQEDPGQAANRHREAKERESAYKNAMKNIPDGKANKDPWAGAR